MISIDMKLADLLLESSTDVVARHYKEASSNFDAYYNKECELYKQKSEDYYQKYFEQWYKDGSIPVIAGDDNKDVKKYSTVPTETSQQSPGYRGLQYAKARAGQKYDKNVQPPPHNTSLDLSSRMQDLMPKLHQGGY